MRKHSHYRSISLRLILAFLPVIISCEFEPLDIPEKVIEKPPVIAPGILIEITPETDTIKTAEPEVVIRYNASATPRTVTRVKFDIDGETVYLRDYNLNGPIEMTLETREYSDGLHHLTITFFTNSNSGSIADKIGAEGYMYTMEWPLIIDRTTIRDLQFISIVPVENGVRLEWEKFNHPVFKNYTLRKYSDSFSADEYITVISDPNQNYFIDTSYLEGEKATYNISLNGSFGNYENYSEFPKSPIIEPTGNFGINVSWEKTRNPGILDYYYLYIENEYPVKHGEFKLYNADSTSRTIDRISFGKNYKFILQYIPETSHPVNFYGINKGVNNFTLGDSIPPHDVSRSIHGNDNLLLINDQEVSVWNANTNAVTPLFNAAFDISWSINVAPSGESFGYFADGEFIVRNSSSFETEYTIPSYRFSSDRKLLYTLSDNNRLLIGYSNGNLVLHDLITGNVIAEKPGNNNAQYAKISPDGNFIMVRNFVTPTTQTYYHIIDSSFIEIAQLIEPENARSQYFTFSPDGRLFLFYKGKVEIRNGTDFSLINEYNLPSGNVEAWDFDTGLLLTEDYYTEAGFLIDIYTGTIKKNLVIGGNSYFNIKKDFITSGIGRKMTIPALSNEKNINSSEYNKVTDEPNFNKFLR